MLSGSLYSVSMVKFYVFVNSHNSVITYINIILRKVGDLRHDIVLISSDEKQNLIIENFHN